VPISGSNEKIRLLGATQGILSVKALQWVRTQPLVEL
jgi:hypothetical protein